MHSQVNAGSERRKLASTMTPIDEMRQAYRLARQAEPRARHREIAAARGVSEGELIAAHVGANPDGLTARRLMPCWASLLRAMPQLGTVMCLTRNEHCVHEKVGRFEDVQIAADDAPMGLVLGPDIDLRIFFRTWAHAFAVQEPRGADGALQSSVQFFDAAGHAVHKVFARPQTDGRAWQALIDSHAADDQVPGMLVAPTAAPTPERADDEVDVAALRQDWAAMQDTHEFFGLLRRHGVSRTQAVRLADPALALKLANNAVRVLLQAAA
ncbi:MAG: hemin-degrading factor, partial [Burkholderiaceae bacterium]|nr:hemin-degrading factor [Burkholderiaceae bacterium]